MSKQFGAWTAAIVATCLASPALAGADTSLAPYQMVRSLQLVQDKIAAGDHAAIPMQRKLLQMIDERFKDTESEDYSDLRNYRAMLVYAMSGGNPKTIEVALARIHLDETDRALGIGILDYLRGNALGAQSALHDVDPLKISSELGAFFALVKGSVNAAEDPAGALKLFDEARLLAPGSLVEEAALRRTISLSAESADTDRFMKACEKYVRRFLASPYASQFADAFVAGVVTLHDKADRAKLAEIILMMDLVQQKTIYLRLARRAAIDGHGELAGFASAEADKIKVEGFGPDIDPRAELYASLASVTSETVDDVMARLKEIDRTSLSKRDRELLEAAEAMGTQVVNVPVAPAEPAKPAPSEAEMAAVDPAEADLIPEGEPLPADTGAETTAAHEPTSLEPAKPAPVETALERAKAKAAEVKVEADPADEMVVDTRKRLQEIDKLLGETVQ